MAYLEYDSVTTDVGIRIGVEHIICVWAYLASSGVIYAHLIVLLQMLEPL